MSGILGAEPITRRRFSAGARGADGRYAPGGETDSVIQASVQDSSPDDSVATELLGERTKRVRVLYSTSELRAVSQAEGTAADQVELDGDDVWWEVRVVARARSLLAHYKAYVTAVQEAE